jgi:hypothetical protein
MAAATQTRLSDAQLGELLTLLKGVDTFELKLTLEPGTGRAAIAALDLDPLDAQIRQVFFFDTPDLTLNQQGLVVRARRVQGKGDDTVVKLRPVAPDDLSPELRRSPAFNVEVDAMPGGFVCSASMKGVAREPGVRTTLVEGRPLRKLFTKEQRAFFKAHAPEGMELDDLAVLGPVFVLKVKTLPAHFPRKLVAELWLYPDNSRIIELSAKCAPAEAFQAAAELRAFLAEHGVEPGEAQETKTRRALDYFSERLAAG